MKIPCVSVLLVIGKITLFLNLFVNSNATDNVLEKEEDIIRDEMDKSFINDNTGTAVMPENIIMTQNDDTRKKIARQPDLNFTLLSLQPKAAHIDIDPDDTDDIDDNNDDYYDYDEAKYGAPDQYPKVTEYLERKNKLSQNKIAQSNMSNDQKLLYNFQHQEPDDKTRNLGVTNSSLPQKNIMEVKRRNPQDYINPAQKGVSFNNRNDMRAIFSSYIPQNPIPDNQNDKYGVNSRGNSNDIRPPQLPTNAFDDYQHMGRKNIDRYNSPSQQRLNQYNILRNTQQNPTDNMNSNHGVNPAFSKQYNSGKVSQPQMFSKPKPNNPQIPYSIDRIMDYFAIKPFPEQNNNIAYVQNDQPFSMVNGKINNKPLTYDQIKSEVIQRLNSGKLHMPSDGAQNARTDVQKTMQRMPNAPYPSQHKQNFQMPLNIVSQNPRQQYFQSQNQGRQNVAPNHASSQMLIRKNPAQNQYYQNAYSQNLAAQNPRQNEIARNPNTQYQYFQNRNPETQNPTQNQIPRNQNTQNQYFQNQVPQSPQQNQPTWNQIIQNHIVQKQYSAPRNAHPNQFQRNQYRQDENDQNQTPQSQIEQNPDHQNLEQPEQPLSHLSTDLTTVQTNEPSATIDYDIISGWYEMDLPSLTTVLSNSTVFPLSSDAPAYYSEVTGTTNVLDNETQAKRDLLISQAKSLIVDYHVGFLTAFGFKLMAVLEDMSTSNVYFLMTGFKEVTDRMINEGKLKEMGDITLETVQMITSFLLSWVPRRAKGELETYGVNLVRRKDLSKEVVDMINILDAAYLMDEGEALVLTLIDVDGYNRENNYTNVEIAETVVDALLKPYWRIVNTPKHTELFSMIHKVLINKRHIFLMAQRRRKNSQFDEIENKRHYAGINRIKNKNRTEEQSFNSDQVNNSNKIKTKQSVNTKYKTERQSNNLKYISNKEHRIEIDKRYYNKRKEVMKLNPVPSQYHNDTYKFDAKKIKADQYFEFSKYSTVHKDDSRNITTQSNISMLDSMPDEFSFLKPILDNQKLDYYKWNITTNKLNNERRPLSAIKQLKDILQEGFNYEKIIINKYDTRENKTLNDNKKEKNFVNALANTKQAYKSNQKRFHIVNTNQTIANKSKNVVLETILSSKTDKNPAQYVARIDMKHTEKSKYLEPAYITRQSYRKAIDYTKDAESKRYTKIKNIIEESDYSDDEKVLKFVLSDAMRHSNFVMHNNSRRNDEVIKPKNNIHGMSSYSDEEWQIKNNIYKTFGYEPDLDAKNKE